MGIALVAYPKASRIISVLVGLKKGEIFWKETSNDLKSVHCISYHSCYRIPVVSTGWLMRAATEALSASVRFPNNSENTVLSNLLKQKCVMA